MYIFIQGLTLSSPSVFKQSKQDESSLFMENNNDKVIIKTRSPVDRRKFNNRRSFLKQGYLDHNPERRVNKIDRRIHGDRRRMLSKLIYNFWKKDS